MSLPPIFLWPFTFVAVACLVSAGILAPQFARRRETGASVLLWSAMGVMPGWIFQQGWVTSVTLLGGILLVITLSLLTGAIPATIAVLHHSRARTRPIAVWVVAAFSFFLWEMLRAHVLIGGYAWALAAQPLIDARPLSAAASVVGASGVSFLAIAIAACGATIIVTRQRKKTAIAGAAIACLWGGLSFVGWSPMDRGPARTIRAAILQTNVPQDNKTNATPLDEFKQWQRLEKLIAAAAAAEPQMILWPETMLPGPTLEPSSLAKLYDEQIYYNLPPDPQAKLSDEVSGASIATGGRDRRVWATAYADRLLEVSAALNIPMLVGADCIEGIYFEKVGDNIRMKYNRRYNSVYLVDQGFIRRDTSIDERPPIRYDKVYLTPFGEQIPFVWRFDGFSDWFTAVVARGMIMDLSSGIGGSNAYTVFTISDPANTDAPLARVVTPICFESTIADHHRRLIFNPDGTRRADLIASVTNDGWFAGSDMQRDQHLQIVRWRTVETATPAVRAANTGISAVVDATGRIVAHGVDGQVQAQRVEGVLTRELSLGVGRTWYTTLGQWPARIVALLGAVMALAGLLPRRSSEPV